MITMNTPIETERKFLIKMPALTSLEAFDGIKIMHMEQTYLICADGNARVRKICENGTVRYIKTVKKRISTLSCYEDEQEISEQAYIEELKSADPKKSTVYKTRYAFPYRGHTVEIDVYPFWDDRAILEVELDSESESFDLPENIEVIKEVSEDKRYKNTNLALWFPFDTI